MVEGVEMMALVDTWSQISALTKGFCTEFVLGILPLRGLLHLEQTGGVPIPYKGYVEANLSIPGLPQYNEDVLSFSDSKSQIGTQVIDHLVMTMTGEELQWARETWKQVHLSTVISKRNSMMSLNVPEYNFKGVMVKIHSMREVIIPPFVTTIVTYYHGQIL